MKKDIIYIDSDDEIAAVVDKVVASRSKVVALVLPKRFTMLHSSVNMKILNKAANDNNKNLVLITNEKALMPLAAATGMYVAKGLQSKPAIPALAEPDTDLDDAVEAPELDAEPTIDKTKPIGELAGDTDETITIDNTTPEDTAAKKPDTPKKSKKLAVPNFEKFRLKLFLIIAGVIALLMLLYFAVFVWPKATVTLSVEQQEIPLSIDITASPTKEDNVSEKVFKLDTKTIDKAETKSGEATGKKDLGEKATGSVTMVNCSKDDKLADVVRTIPAGTGISNGNHTFITQESVQVSPSGFNGNTCKNDKPSSSVKVIAQNAGGEYNLSARSYSVSGFSTVTAKDSKGMGGGTSKVVTIVSQEDCTALTDQLNAASNSDELKKQLMTDFEQAGLAASIDTYKVDTVSSSCEPAVGQEANSVSAKATYRYTMSGVNADSLNELITQEALEKAGQGQTIADTGIKTAVINVNGRSGSTLDMTVNTTAIAGVKQDEAAIKSLIAGKNARQTADALKQIPGVKDVKVDYSPFWVNKTPKKESKISIVFVTNNDN